MFHSVIPRVLAKPFAMGTIRCMALAASATTSTTASNIGTAILVFAAVRGEKQGELAEALGMTDYQLSRRLNGKARWSPDELQAVAEHFELPSVGLLFMTPTQLLDRLRASGYKQVNAVDMPGGQMELLGSDPRTWRAPALAAV